MKNAIVLLSLLFLTACGAAGGSTSQKVPDALQPGFVAPINNGGDPSGTSQVTYYKLSKTEAPVNGWSLKTYTASGMCVSYASKVYCWDDGVKTLQWTDFNGTHYGPFTYTYFGYDTNGSSWGSCRGACQTDLMSQPRYMSPTLTTNMTAAPANNVFTNGTPITVTCTENSGTLSCGDFTIDLNQVAL